MEMPHLASDRIVLRPAGDADRDVLTALIAAYRQELGFADRPAPADGSAPTPRAPTPDDLSGLWLALRAETPVGFAQVFELPELLSGRRAGQIDDLFIAPDHRGRGHARAVIDALARQGRARGWRHLRWLSPGADYPANALYDRLAARPGWVSFEIALT